MTGKAPLAMCLALDQELFLGPRRSKKSIVLSSTKAEYIAATSTACHAIWLRRILCDLKEKQDGPTLMICDNESTIAMTKKSSTSTTDQAH